MPGRKINIDYNILYDLYINKNYMVKEIAELLNTSIRVIKLRLHEHNIHKPKDLISKTYSKVQKTLSDDVKQVAMKKRKTARYEHFGAYCNNCIELNFTKEEFYNYYIEENHTQKECCKYFCCTKREIRKACSIYGIRKDYKKQGELAKRLRGHKFVPLIDKNELYNYYIVEDHSFKECVTKFNVKKGILAEHLKEYNIQKDHKQRLNRIKKTKFERHGDENYNNSQSIDQQARMIKVINTKKANGHYGSSIPEEKYYDYLISIYGEDDIVRQYNKDPRYPYLCDFYIKSEDLFIELNYYWTHYEEPFDKNNSKHLEILKVWETKSKKSKHYEKAIENWTIKDLEKINCAIKNNLNYMCYYSKGVYFPNGTIEWAYF